MDQRIGGVNGRPLFQGVGGHHKTSNSSEETTEFKAVFDLVNKSFDDVDHLEESDPAKPHFDTGDDWENQAWRLLNEEQPQRPLYPSSNFFV